MSDATGSRAAKMTDFRAGYEFGYCDGQVGEYQPEKHRAAHATPDRSATPDDRCPDCKLSGAWWPSRYAFKVWYCAHCAAHFDAEGQRVSISRMENRV